MAANDKRPVLLRTMIALIVIGVFAYSTYPLQEKDFYETFLTTLKEAGNPAAQKLVENARTRQTRDPELFASNALLAAANDDGVLLTDLLNIPKADDNRDAISALRKKGSASIRRGIDLNGGVEFMMELVPDQDFLERAAASGKESEAEAGERMGKEFNRYRDLAIEVLRKRLESHRIFESEISPAGGRFISLKAPITSKDEKSQLKDLLSMSAKLHFRLVHPDSAALVEQMQRDPRNFVPPVGYELMEISEFQPGQKAKVQRYFVEKRWQMDGKGIVDARAVRDEFNRRKIVFRFDSAGSKAFANVTTKYKGRQLAVVLDGKLYTAPTIQTEILSGSGEITGQFSDEEVNNIANALVSGSFPFMIRVDSVYDVDPTLGADNVANGVRAGIYAMIAVVVFMVGYYLVAGIVAVAALALNVILVLGALAAFDATLTLPGIAGIILTIGMAVDANVLIFERIREESAAGKNIQTAVDAGYAKALSAVIDANLTTLFTGMILYWAGTGAVKGFAVTLSIGIITSLFTALFVTRLIFDYLLRFGLKKLPMLMMLKNPRLNFLGYRNVAFLVSGALIVGSLVVIGMKGHDMFGVDLVGGTVVVYNYREAAPQQGIIDTLNKAGFTNPRIAYKVSAAAADNHKLEVMVRNSGEIGDAHRTPGAQIQELLNQAYPQLRLSGGQETSVGGLVGAEFSKSAILALIASMIGMIVYISLRYEFAYAMAGIIALIHDVIIATGIFLLLDRQISLAVIAAILTTIGYSINDTIVVFDRIREDLRAKSGDSYQTIINRSINQTLNRTLLTSLTTLLVIVVLMIFGGIAINDFVLLMFLGVVIGTYSSIFIASPIVALWHRKIVGIKETDTNFDESKVVEA